MALVLGGIKSRYYGECDRRADGSYTSTEWLTIAFLPFFPMGSARLVRVVPKKNYFLSKLQTVGVVERINQDWFQVLRVYAFLFTFFYWISLSRWFYEKKGLWDGPHASAGIALFLVGCFLPFVILGEFRRRNFNAVVQFSPASAFQEKTKFPD